MFLALGANQGDREGMLRSSLRAIVASPFAVTVQSALYLTEPVGGPPQDWYLNQVIGGDTQQSPHELLRACLAFESAHGRVRGVPNAPRTLDIDILFYDDQVIDTPELVLPHPRLHERRFVLVPLVEIAPELVHPRLGLTARELLARCPDRSQVLLHAPAGKRA